MKKEHEQVITDFMRVYPICINSKLVSAQNRIRYYWTNIPNVQQPEDKGITWGDIKEQGINKYYYTEKGLQWLAKNSRRKNKTLDVWANNEKAQMVEASHNKYYSNQRFFGICDFPTDESVIASMRGRRINKEGKREDYNKEIDIEQHVEFRYDGKSNCLTTVAKDNIVVPFTLPNRIPLKEFFFRYITPVECERLQQIPDNWTSCVSDNQRYKIIGNGWSVDVIAHIFKNIPKGRA